MQSKPAVWERIAKKVRRMRKFAAAGASWRAVPALMLAGLAREGTFGETGPLSRGLGKAVGVIGVRTKASAGAVAWVDTHDLGNIMSCEEVLIDGGYDLSLVPFQPKAIVDCGAHIGLFSLIAALRFPEAAVTAFEPNPTNYALARQQLARFGDRVHLHEAAVATKEGEAWFAAEESNTGQLRNGSAPAGVLVKTVNLVEAIQKLGNLPLLLKMDIEGTENELLPHLVPHLPYRCAVFFESHGGRQAWCEVSTLLTDAGFQVRQTRDRDECCDAYAIRGI